MMRTSVLQKSLQSCRYLVNHKKPIVEMPSNKPPKYIYKIKYHPIAPPTFDEYFQDHQHANPFDDLAMNDMELYRFKYSGQWWYIGGFFSKIAIILFPFWLFYMMLSEGAAKAKSGKQSLATWKNIPEFLDASKIIAPEF